MAIARDALPQSAPFPPATGSMGAMPQLPPPDNFSLEARDGQEPCDSGPGAATARPSSRSRLHGPQLKHEGSVHHACTRLSYGHTRTGGQAGPRGRKKSSALTLDIPDSIQVVAPVISPSWVPISNSPTSFTDHGLTSTHTVGGKLLRSGFGSSTVQPVPAGCSSYLHYPEHHQYGDTRGPTWHLDTSRCTMSPATVDFSSYSPKRDMNDTRPLPAMPATMGVENFSRPLKPSIFRCAVPGNAMPRSRPTYPWLAEPTPCEQDQSVVNWSPKPVCSMFHVSCPAVSANAYAPSFHHRASNDQLCSAPRTGSLRSVASCPMRPSVTYKSNPNLPPTVKAISLKTQEDEEFRLSFRSQTTSSAAPGTIYSAARTERCHHTTKTSSAYESFIHNGCAPASAATVDGPGVDDVMGLYIDCLSDDFGERGRRPTSDRETVKDDDNGFSEIDINAVLSRLDNCPPLSPMPDGESADAKVLEAVSDALPMLTTETVEALFPHDITVENATAFYKRSRAKPPDDVDLFISEHRQADKHDSAELADSGDDFSQRENRAESYSTPIQASTPSLTRNNAAETVASKESTLLSTPASSVQGLLREPEEEPGMRDRYGFRKATAHITREQYEAWEGPYNEYLARRRKKWVAHLQDHSLMTETPNRFPPRSNKTKRYVRKGIPPDWRGAVWFYYAGGPAIMAKHRGVYDDLVKHAGLDAKDSVAAKDGQTEVKELIVEDIEKDLHRTFPDNLRFKPPTHHALADSGLGYDSDISGQDLSISPVAEPKIISALRRVLHAFALYNPRIGYCQSLNFLAGLLLLFVNTEEQAFWLLNVITRVYLPGTHETSLEGSKVDLAVLMLALKESLPNTWKHIADDEPASSKWTRGRRANTNPTSPSIAVQDPNRLPDITVCMTAWFMSCFIGTLPVETVLRVWDVFFYEGSHTLFRVALGIFKSGEAEICKIKDPMEMFGVVQAIPRRLLDCNALLDICYKKRGGIGNLSQGVVEDRRRERRDGIRRWKAEKELPLPDGGNHLDSPGKTVGGIVAFPDLATSDWEAVEVRRKGMLFAWKRNKDREQIRAAEVV